MKLYVYIFKRLDLKRFEFSKIYLLIADHSFQIYCSVCIVFIVSICVSFLYIYLTSETLHYPWIPSLYNRPQLQKGIVKRVPVGELDSCQAHYLPHHGVVRSEKETTKLRVVFDGSAKENESKQSINDHLETGRIIYHLCSTP